MSAFAPQTIHHGLRLALLAVVVILAVLFAACGGGSGNDGSQSSRTGAREPFAVGSESVTLVDPTRETPPWNEVPAVSSRTIETLVLYPAHGEPSGAAVPGAPPAVAGPYPVVVFLHGAGTVGEDYQRAIEPWAEAGYIVVAPTAPLGGFGLAHVADAANHPQDVRFALAELPDAINRTIGAIADFDRVAVVGKSLGAATALAVAFDPCCTNDVIRGVVAMAGPQSPFIAADTRMPTLVVHGDADEIFPYTDGRANFDAAPKPKFFLTLFDTTHAPTLAVQPAGPTDDAVVETAIDFFDRYLKSDKAALDRMRRHGNVTGVARLESPPNTGTTSR